MLGEFGLDSWRGSFRQRAEAVAYVRRLSKGNTRAGSVHMPPLWPGKIGSKVRHPTAEELPAVLAGPMRHGRP